MKKGMWGAGLCALALLAVRPVLAQNEGGPTPQDDTRFADELRFNMIEDHVRTMELCMEKITKLSTQPYGTQTTLREQQDHSSNKLGRFIEMKEQAADAVHSIISDYFMTVRLRNWPNVKKNPEGYGSQEYQNFAKMLEYLQSALTYNMWCRQLTMPEKPRAVRKYMASFRTLWEDPANKALQRGPYRQYVLDDEH